MDCLGALSGSELEEAAPARLQLEAGDFDALVSEHQRRIYRILWSLTRDADAAETLTQECFLRAFEKRRSFRGDARASTWLVRIALNLAKDHQRSRRRGFWRRIFFSQDGASGQHGAGDAAATEGMRAGQRWSGVAAAQDEMAGIADRRASAEAALVAKESVGAMWNAIARLPERQRAVFVLRFIEEMSLGEISAATGLALGTVKTHAQRATLAVRRTMTASGHGYERKNAGGRV